jgi:NAD(P)-dependent dehydrogenase (short-subunit alcohol dehydrogenase family)
MLIFKLVLSSNAHFLGTGICAMSVVALTLALRLQCGLLPPTLVLTSKMQLTNKVCLVTGGTRGIGAATALVFAEAGAAVSLVARRADEVAEGARAAIARLGRKCIFIAADLAKPESVVRCVEQTVAELGALDVLVHSAGGPVPGGLFELTPAAWYGAFDIHVHPIFHLCRAAVPHMRRRGEGAIVLISSSAGKRALRTNLAYQAVKGALPQLTRALAFELANDNIRVNCAAPGVIRTDFHLTMPAEVKQNNLEHRIPLHREGTPAQVATLIRELVTNDYITGETVSIDGGLTMRIC